MRRLAIYAAILVYGLTCYSTGCAVHRCDLTTVSEQDMYYELARREGMTLAKWNNMTEAEFNAAIESADRDGMTAREYRDTRD